jgi:hypothetical protein
MSLARRGATTYFFFIRDRLWKIVDEMHLAEGGPLGSTYSDAVVQMAVDYGVTGRVRATGTTSGGVEVDWQDITTHLRAIQRSDVAIALAYEDNRTLTDVTSLRSNKPATTNGVEPKTTGRH